MEVQQLKLCLECGEKLNGRSDKKFCDDACRNAYNNRQNSGNNEIVRNINNQLRKNRRILLSFLTHSPHEMAKVSLSEILQQGFNLKYHTHLYKTAKGQEYHFNYEVGYLRLDDQKILIVKNDK